MPEHWISAAKALEIVGNAQALRLRLGEGLITARARVCAFDNKRLEDRRVPARLWSDGLGIDVPQWCKGDFSAWSRKSGTIKALGVLLDAEGVLAMVPEGKRAMAARGLSVVAHPDWITAREALGEVGRALQLSTLEAQAALIQRAALGLIEARAVLYQRAMGLTEAAGWATEIREWDIPSDLWAATAVEPHGTQDWTLGLFAGVYGESEGMPRFFRLVEVHIHRDSVAAFADRRAPDQASTSEAEPAPIKASAGRLPAAFGDEMICAIWGQIYRGDFNPRVQSEVLRALLDWASTKGHSLGDTVAKEKAKRIWTEFKREVGNTRI
jgi:hypothetical protein